ncbi:MAG: hypothetical protein ACM336_13235 [Acidobacteriota bacterium]
MSILETRFVRLVRHFFAGFLNNDLLISSEAGFENALSQIMGLIVAPGLFYGLLAFWKYGSLPDRTREMLAWEDMLLFTAFTIVLTGLLTVVEWDALFPDFRDYHILTPLPLTTRLLFLAKLSSILLLLAIFWGAANFGPAFLFSVAALPDGAPWFDLARRFAAHLVATFGAAACVFLFFFGLQGVLLNLLKPKWFRRASVYIQLALVLVLTLSLFVMPFVLYSGIRWIRGNDPWIYYLPPFWFLGLYQVLIGHGGPVFSPLAGLAVKALGAVAAVSALAYVASYNRHVKKSLESPETARSGPGFLARTAEAALNRFVLKHPIERACFHFIRATLLRSGLHRLLLAAYVGLGFALVLVTAAVAAFQSGAARPTPGLLSVQLVLVFFVLSGMRFAFSLPAELRANWAFQATGPAARSRWGVGVRKAMLAFGVCPVLLVLLPVHVLFWGWTLAAAHLLYGAALSVLLVELLLLTFDKIPFTCTYLPGKANVKALWPVYLAACYGYSYGMARLESGLLASPPRFALFCLAALAAIAALRRYRRRRFGPGFRFVFEEAPEPAVRTLNIAFGSEREGMETCEPSSESSLTGDVPARFCEATKLEREHKTVWGRTC